MASRIIQQELARMERSQLLRRLGIARPWAEAGRATLELPYRGGLANSGGNLHGGAIATLAMSAAGLAVASSERLAESCQWRPVHLALSYLEAVRGDDTAARAEVAKRGRDTVHVAVQIGAGKSRVATALLVYSIATGAVQDHEHGGIEAAAAGLPAVSRGEPARLAISPFLSTAGMQVLSTDQPWVCGKLPAAGNDDGGGFLHEGMLVTMVDFCGALASYAGGRVHRRRGGSTVALSVAFSHRVSGDVFGAGRLVSRSGESFSSQAELWPEGTAEVCALGSVSYRIPRLD